jgi:transposase
MPLPKPHYQPQFTPEQLAQARKVVAQHSTPQREVRRARLTLVLAAHPDLSHAESGALCDRDDETVYKWRRRGATHGWSLADAPRPGRPAAFPPEAQVLVKALACERPTDARRRPLSRFSVGDVCQRPWELGVPIPYSTLWRTLSRDAIRL